VLLLDTHVWIWSAEGADRKIGRRARQLLSQAESKDALRVSTVSLFELAALHTQGRLRLAHPLEQWIGESLEAGGVRIAELSAAMSVDAGLIPRRALADPLDRLLVATARQMGARLLTADARILDYAAANYGVRVDDARL
jgi:PIN domain nuclease of toxin-antitoxin system